MFARQKSTGTSYRQSTGLQKTSTGKKLIFMLLSCHLVGGVHYDYRILSTFPTQSLSPGVQNFKEIDQ